MVRDGTDRLGISDKHPQSGRSQHGAIPTGRTFNPLAVGSSPTALTRKIDPLGIRSVAPNAKHVQNASKRSDVPTGVYTDSEPVTTEMAPAPSPV